MILKQFKKFIIFGGLSTIINYSVFYLLFTSFNLAYLFASSLGYIFGLIFGYILNRKYTFSSTNTEKLKEFTSYLMIYLTSLFLSLNLLNLLVENLNFNPLLANIFAIALSTMTNFAGCKLFVFKIQSK